MNTTVRRFAKQSEASLAAGEFITETCRKAIEARGIFSLVLAGGNTPRLLYQLLGAPPLCDRIDWQKTCFFWGDERCVPLDHPDSNYAMCRSTLFAVTLPPEQNIYRIRGEVQPPEKAAALYEESLRSFFGVSEEPPATSTAFDLVLLGMGKDGHTASLFPGSSGMLNSDRYVMATCNHFAAPDVPRVTMTPFILNQARNICFLISGQEKGQIMQNILENHDEAAAKYPAALIRPLNEGELIWFFSEHS